MPDKSLLPLSPSVLSSPCVGSIKQLRISSLSSQFLVWVIEKSQPVLNHGSRAGWIIWGSLVSPKTRRQSSKNTPVHCSAETQAQRDELERSISYHLFMKLTVYSLFLLHKFMVNDKFSIKKCSQHCFYPRCLHSHFLSFYVPFMPIKHTCSR
jgi:hypothetical protein